MRWPYGLDCPDGGGMPAQSQRLLQPLSGRVPLNLILDATVDRYAAIKQACYTCEFLLKHAPRVGQVDRTCVVVPEAVQSDSESSVSIHCF